MADFKEVWPNFKVKDPIFKWLPGEIQIKTYNLNDRDKMMPNYSNKVACKYKR